MELKDKKPEKLASALYLITSFFDDQEPIKWKLRALASKFVSLTMSFKERQIATLETKNIVLEIIGFLSIVKNAGLISTGNHDLIKEELMKYVDTLDYPINISDFLNIESSKPRVKEIGGNQMIKDKNGYKLPEVGAVSIKKTNRRSAIIAVLKHKKEIMIKDISPLINGCSEKTIQRELSAMVRAGVLRKMGEKRWSHYILA